MKISRTALGLVILSATIAGAAAVRQQTQAQTYAVPYSVRSDAFGQGDVASIDPAIGYTCTMGVNSLRKHFSLEWNYAPSVEVFQIVPVGFTPTSIAQGTSLFEFLVAGTSTTGKTKIIKYAFDPPALLADGTIAEAELNSSQVLFSAPALGGLQDITLLKQNKGNPGTYFVRFNSSGDIYLFDGITGALGAPVASSDSSSGAPILAPELDPSYRYQTTNVFEHTTHGFIYMNSSSDPSVGMLVLADSDKDGNLDYHLIVPTQGDYAQFGLDTGYILD